MIISISCWVVGQMIFRINDFLINCRIIDRNWFNCRINLMIGIKGMVVLINIEVFVVDKIKDMISSVIY